MKMNFQKKFSGLLLLVLFPGSMLLQAQSLTATDVVRKADENFRGEKSGYSEMTMTIVRPSWQRTVQFRSWSMGSDYSLSLITAPAREKGQTFLKRGSEMWSWNPAINRLIKLPPSMMSQGWMGSDYTNDDLLKESSVTNDYTHVFDREEAIEGRNCYHIIMQAKPESDVLWSKQIWWVDKENFVVLKAELYDEDGYLVRTENATAIKNFDGRMIPSHIELIPAANAGYKTVLEISGMKFNINIPDSFFSQQNMKVVR